MDLYAGNDELFPKLKAGNPGYDVIVPTNDFVERIIAAGMLMPLDHAAIPNMANIELAFRDAAFDPGRRHSIPYMWGMLGIGYRKSRCDGAPDSWRWLYDSDRYSWRCTLLGEGVSPRDLDVEGGGSRGPALRSIARHRPGPKANNRARLSACG